MTGEPAHPDDRAAFLEERRVRSLALGRDTAAFDACTAAIEAVDAHKYAYLWTWLGVPVIQLPADIMAAQEVVWATRPDVIVETGVARGGSMIFLASMLELTGKGRVIGVDIDIRAHNRDSIEAHPLARRIHLIEGPSTAAETIAAVRAAIPPNASVMVILDSDHSRDHVLDELRTYGPLVTPGQYLVVADTLLGRLRPEQTPRDRSKVWEPGNEPLSALNAWLRETDAFAPDPEINGKLVLSSSPGGYLRRLTEAEKRRDA
jgi:cephalosporin hydroxylase